MTTFASYGYVKGDDEKYTPQNAADIEKFIRRLKSFENAEVLTREMCNELIEYVKIDRYVSPTTPRDIYIHCKLLDS